MSFNRIMAAVGYLVAWFVVLPAFVGVFALFLALQALMADLAALLFGCDKPMDSTSARTLANRMCLGTRPLRTY